MNDLHVLVIMNLRNASSEHVVSILGNVRRTRTRLVSTLLRANETNNLMLVRVPPQILEDLVGAAITKQGNIYKGELAKLIGASKESLDGKTSFYLISLMKLCGFAEADMAKILKKSRIVNQRGAVTRDISAGEELKGVIDSALEGFQMLIAESFKPIGQEEQIVPDQRPIKRRSDENPKD